MSLKYRGLPYVASTMHVETIESKMTAQFLGRRYQIRHAPTQPVMRSPMTLMFLGVSYSA